MKIIPGILYKILENSWKVVSAEKWEPYYIDYIVTSRISKSNVTLRESRQDRDYISAVYTFYASSSLQLVLKVSFFTLDYETWDMRLYYDLSKLKSFELFVPLFTSKMHNTFDFLILI